MAKSDLAKNKIKWLPPAPLDNTYAIGVRKDQMTGVKTLSDYARLVRADPMKGSLCVRTGFTGRAGGLPAFEKAFGFKGEKLTTLEGDAV